jgi:hypothetical protein
MAELSAPVIIPNDHGLFHCCGSEAVRRRGTFGAALRFKSFLSPRAPA